MVRMSRGVAFLSFSPRPDAARSEEGVSAHVAIEAGSGGSGGDPNRPVRLLANRLNLSTLEGDRCRPARRWSPLQAVWRMESLFGSCCGCVVVSPVSFFRAHWGSSYGVHRSMRAISSSVTLADWSFADDEHILLLRVRVASRASEEIEETK